MICGEYSGVFQNRTHGWDAMATAEPIRIVVADDFPPVREALRKLFGEFAALEVVGEAADGNSAIEMTLHLVPGSS